MKNPLTMFIFENGKATVKSGRRTIAKIYDRNTFFKGTRLENSFTQFPYSVEMFGGTFECINLDEAVKVYEKYRPQ